uniref:DUF924 domain-containing protein n=1 Tax=Palpitomonas bilix TaxID=652834 RepID=A0A7S3D9T1_9EUKA|mmetsp:Transcript_28255/g.72081  ORF Transcript_28255/g.72081 Transcript_28255/m.72081 type:complete len:215 (+) Transcript_28255:17-661(+)
MRPSPSASKEASRAVAQRILSYWYPYEPTASPIQKLRAVQQLWFAPSADRDASIREDFKQYIDEAVDGQLDSWKDENDTGLALIILADQFTRNIYRQSAKAFAGDEVARSAASALLDRGCFDEVDYPKQMTLLLPFMHAESLADQQRAVALAEKAVEKIEDGDKKDAMGVVSFAVEHRNIIEKYGRFPYRNAALGRESTPAEEEFLLNGPRFGQ